MAIIVISLIRNFGALNLYLLGLNTQPASYLCRFDPTSDFIGCKTSLICDRALDVAGFEFKVDDMQVGHLNNWYVTLDLMCKSNSEIGSIVSIQFAGFLVGTLFFFCPDTFGRRESIKLLCLPFVICQYLVVFGETIHLKKIGFFF